MEEVSKPQLAPSGDDPAGSPPRSWWREGFLAHVFTLASGTTAAQVLLVVCSPILTRLYTPSEFAAYALYAAAVTLLATFAAGRYEWALMLPKDDAPAANLLWLAVLLSTVFSVVLAVLLGSLVWLAPFDWHAALHWASWVPAGVLSLSLWGALVKWQSRRCRFGLIARSEIGYAAGALLTQVLGARLVPGSGGAPLIAGHILGRLVSAVILAWPLMADMRPCRQEIHLAALTQQSRRYWRFPVFSSGASLLGGIVGELPKILLGIMASASALGFYSLAMRALRMPVFMVGQAVSSAFFPHISRLSDDRAGSQRLLLRTCGALLAVGVLPALVVLLYAEPMFALAFGEPWRPAGGMARLLVPLVLAEFAFSPIRTVLQTQEKQHVFMLWQVLFLIGTIGAFAVWAWTPIVDAVVLAYSLMSAVMFVVLFAMAWHSVRKIPPATLQAEPPAADEAPPQPEPLAA